MEEKDILDYDQMKIEEGGENGGAAKPTLSHLNQTISDAFKPKKLKEAGAPLRKYIETFVAYDFKQKPDHMVIEDDEPATVAGVLQTNKIDKAAYCRDLQKCMNKWNKNKGVAELNDVFAKLAKDPSEADAAAGNKAQKDASYSVPSTKEDSKKRKKGGSSSHATNAVAAANNIKDPVVKDPPALRKSGDSMILESSAAPASGNAATGTAAVKDSKKGKDKENIDELAIMYYENPLKDAEFETMFKASITANKSFPRRLEEVPLVGFEKAVEKDPKYVEMRLDSEYDNFVQENCLELESYVTQINKKFSKDPKRMKDEATKMRLNSLRIECTVGVHDMFTFLPHVEEKPFFVFIDRSIKFIKVSENAPEFKKQLDNITWPLYADFFFERLHHTHGNKYSIITDALNSNILTKGNF